MNTFYPKRSLKPLVIALTLALSSSAALAEWYEGYVPKQQQDAVAHVGSGYTGKETVSQNAQPGSDVPLAGEAKDMFPMPRMMEAPQGSVALHTPYQMGSGYTTLDQSSGDSHRG